MENNLERPAYYGIVPAIVRYDQDITANAKLLYSEITALANKTGTCWATNKYFSDLYGVLPNRISVWVRQLETKGYIRTKVIKGGLRGIEVPTIMEKDNTPYAKAEAPITQKDNHNNTTNKKHIVDSESQLLSLVNKITGRDFRTLPRGAKKTLGLFSLKEIEAALTALAHDPWHKPKLKELSSDYFLRATTIDRFKGASTAIGDAYGYKNGRKIFTEDEDEKQYWGGELITPQNQERVLAERNAMYDADVKKSRERRDAAK